MTVELLYGFIGILLLIILLGIGWALLFIRVQSLLVKLLKEKCIKLLREIDAINNDIRVRTKIHAFIKEELIVEK